MMELAFSEAVMGALQENGLVGHEENAVVLTLALDVGVIDDEATQQGRREVVLTQLFSGLQGMPDELLKSNQRMMERLLQIRQRRETLRVWIRADYSEDACALRWLCAWLDQWPGILLLASIHQSFLSDTEKGWNGEKTAEGHYLQLVAAQAKTLSQDERLSLIEEWRQLTRDNAPLRVIRHGQLRSVSEDFYDGILANCRPEGRFPVALWLGRAMTAIPGVSDRWLYLRMMAQIEADGWKILVPASEDYPYDAWIG